MFTNFCMEDIEREREPPAFVCGLYDFDIAVGCS